MLAIREGEDQPHAEMPFVGITEAAAPRRPAQHHAAARLDGGDVRLVENLEVERAIDSVIVEQSKGIDRLGDDLVGAVTNGDIEKSGKYS